MHSSYAPNGACQSNRVILVADASGTATTLGDSVTWDRLRSIGAEVATKYGIIFELYPDLSPSQRLQAEAIATTTATAAV